MLTQRSVSFAFMPHATGQNGKYDFSGYSLLGSVVGIGMPSLLGLVAESHRLVASSQGLRHCAFAYPSGIKPGIRVPSKLTGGLLRLMGDFMYAYKKL